MLAASGLTGAPVYRLDVAAMNGVTGSASFALTVTENYSGAPLTFFADSVENANLTARAPDYVFSPTGTAAIQTTGAINIAPIATASTASVADALRDPAPIAGRVASSDEGDDATTVIYLSGYNGSSSNTDNPMIVAGEFDTLNINTATGAYTYHPECGRTPGQRLRRQLPSHSFGRARRYLHSSCKHNPIRSQQRAHV